MEYLQKCLNMWSFNVLAKKFVIYLEFFFVKLKKAPLY